MENEPKEYFFGGIITPEQSLDAALICRSLKITHFSLNEWSPSSKPCIVKATVDSKSMIVARLSNKNPQQRVNLDFHPQSVSVSFTVEGSPSARVSVMGYVHDVDLNTLMAIRNQLGESAFQPNRGAQKTTTGESDGSEKEEMSEEKEEEKEESVTQSTENILPDKSFKPFDVNNYKRFGNSIRYKDIKVGEGNVPIRGHKVRIAYTLSLPDGRTIDSKNQKKESLPIRRSFPIAVGKVCPGLDQMIMTMRSGGERRIIIRPEMAFGIKGHSKANIPGNTTICVDVKLLKC